LLTALNWRFFGAKSLEELPNPENQRESRFERTAVVIQVISESDETNLNTVNVTHMLCRNNSDSLNV
jgi:hypothetical protein